MYRSLYTAESFLVPVELDQRETSLPRIFILLSCMYTCAKIGVSSKIDLLKGELYAYKNNNLSARGRYKTQFYVDCVIYIVFNVMS